MNIALCSDKDGLFLKNILKDYITTLGYTVIDKSSNGCEDFIDSSILVANSIKNKEADLGILIDAFGAGSFMATTKIKGIIAAQVSDEHSAKMTRDHNNTSIITIGSQIVGDELAKNIVKNFLESNYSGGRHQIRVDMLNKML
jgi:galactose-6-phosphate isomerase